MNFFDKTRRIEVGHLDTFAVPIVIKHHLAQSGESFIFTIRRVLENTKRLGRPPEFGDIVFQQTVVYSDLIMITNDNNAVIGCYFYITTTVSQAADIPEGLNSWDLAYVYGDTRKELVPPSEFIVGEVLRDE